MEVYKEIQINFLLWIQKSIGSEFADILFKFLSFLGNVGWIWIVIGFIVLGAGVSEMKRNPIYDREGNIHFDYKFIIPGVTILSALILSVIFTNLILKNLFDSLRPFQVYPYELIVHEPSDSSFPSGHSSASFAAAFAYFKFYKKSGVFFLILAGFIGFSRLYLFVHFPVDVIVGGILGIAYAQIAYELVTRYITKRSIEL